MRDRAVTDRLGQSTRRCRSAVVGVDAPDSRGCLRPPPAAGEIEPAVDGERHGVADSPRQPADDPSAASGRVDALDQPALWSGGRAFGRCKLAADDIDRTIEGGDRCIANALFQVRDGAEAPAVASGQDGTIHAASVEPAGNVGGRADRRRRRIRSGSGQRADDPGRAVRPRLGGRDLSRRATAEHDRMPAESGTRRVVDGLAQLAVGPRGPAVRVDGDHATGRHITGRQPAENDDAAAVLDGNGPRDGLSQPAHAVNVQPEHARIHTC